MKTVARYSQTLDLSRSLQSLHGASGETQILPRLRFGNQRAQQIGRVIGDDNRNTFVLMQPATQAAYARIGIEQIPGSGFAKRDDQPGLDQFDLPCKIWLATLRFIIERLAIARWTAFYDVGYKNILTSLQTNGSQHVIQQLAGLPYKRLTKRILLCAWSLAHAKPVCMCVAHAKHSTRTGVA